MIQGHKQGLGLICPNCGAEPNNFTEHTDGVEDWLVCDLCGAKTDDKELDAAQLPEYPHASDCNVWVSEPCNCATGKIPETEIPW